ncbi:iron hydrogenase [Patescibacteria group bacterium]|nr:iron hydrogenase [Patescibacteria group bacterium]
MREIDFLEMEGEASAQEQVVSLPKVGAITQYLALLGLAVFLPFFHLQMVTGPLVNAILFIATVVLGWRKAVSIAFIPSIVAFSVGLLPVALGPMIPFIMVSNVILVMIFHALWRKNYWLGVGSASVAKFVFLFGSGQVIFNLILKKDLAGPVASVLSWPQLYTALLGGIIAYVFLKFVKRI